MVNRKIPPEYLDEIQSRLSGYKSNENLIDASKHMLNMMNWNHYAYNFTWFGRPVIQLPQDTVTFQELIWDVCPDLIIETGVAHGGSIVFSASMLALLEAFDLVHAPKVIGIDISIRATNRAAIESHPASKWITLIEGSSVSPEVVSKVHHIAKKHKKVMLFLDSNHTHDHVLAELQAYAELVTPNSYCIILDTGIEDIDPSAIAPGKPWGKGNSPKSALEAFTLTNSHFEVDTHFQEKAWFMSAQGGILRRKNVIDQFDISS